MGRFTYDSTKRLDRLARHLALTAAMIEGGAVASGMRYQLEVMQQVIADVLTDEELSDQTWICRELNTAG